MDVGHGGNRGTSPPRIWSGRLSPRFCHVAKFLAPDYLHYNVEKCVFLPLQQDFYSQSRHASPQNSSQIYAYD